MSPASPTSVDVTIDGRPLKLSNLDKVLYPATGFTKGEVIDYYTRVAPALLPHLRRRPLTLKRYPNGVDKPYFYEKNCPSHRPPWVDTISVWSGRNQADVNYCLIDELASVVWVANLASLELHTSLSWAPDVTTPSMVVFDLDPGLPATVVECGKVALLLREFLDGLRLAAFPKTSGSKGLQVYVPLNTPSSYDDTKPFALALARMLETAHPALVLSSMAKELRKGKVFIDWSQNDRVKTTVCVYSLRARDRPTVSAPVGWDEVEALVAAGDPDALVFDAAAVLARVAERGDLFAPTVELEQGLPRLPG